MDPFWSVLMPLGYTFCHQLPERSYILGDLQMPVCARCIGIHVGFLLSSIVMWTGARRFSSGMWGRNSLYVLVTSVLAGFALAALSYAGIGFSDNTSRTLSGLLIGTPIPFIVLPVLGMIAFPGRNKRASIADRRDWLLLLAAFGAGAALIFPATGSLPLFYAASIAGVIGLGVFLFTMVTIAVMVLTDGKNLRFRSRLAISAVSGIAVFILLAIGHFVMI